MKILSVQKIREADAYTISQEPILSIDLMERAGKACAEYITTVADKGSRISVVAGQGNNGGDGLVIARLLNDQSYHVEVVVLFLNEQGSPDFETNLKRLEHTGVKIHQVDSPEGLPDFFGFGLIVDALFGSGLTRPVTGLTANLIERINQSGKKVIAIDIPSGLFADTFTDPGAGAVVEADITLSLELPKLAMLMPANHCYTGHWEVIPIGLHPAYLEEAETPHQLFTIRDAGQVFMPRSRVAHKGHFGHGLLLAGSRDKAGAAILSATAALRSGAGLLTACLPAGMSQVLNTALPEAMTVSDSSPSCLTTLPDLSSYNAIAAGPGLGLADKTRQMLHALLQKATCPLVLDADALNILSLHPEWLPLLPAGSVLTPHPKEFERLAGKATDEFHRLEMARRFALDYRCYLVLKCAFTVVVNPEGNCSFNISGNAGLAKGGSGDTLTGILLGLLCRGYSSDDATRLAVFAHGYAAEKAVANMGADALLASDVAANLGKVWKELIVNSR